MDIARIVLIATIFIWLGCMMLQAEGFLGWGRKRIDKSWITYCFSGMLITIFCDALTSFRSPILGWTYLLWLEYFIVFNLAIILDAYKDHPWLNRLEHFCGSFLVTLATAGTLLATNLLGDNPAFNLLVFVSIANAIGALNEVVELCLDKLFNTKNIGPDPYDTNYDLLLNFLASVSVAFLFMLFKLYN